MAFPPFIPATTEDEPQAAANVVEFPRRVAAQEKLRRAQRNLDRCKASINTDDLYSTDVRERVRAGCSISMLDVWIDEVKQAEAELAMLDADDALTWHGKVFRATLSTAGAN